MPLNDDQLDRYARHIILRDVGGAGQQKLLASKVLVIGAGGIGAPALMYLAAAGVGTLGIVDDDKVDLSNLQRQIIHRTNDVGVPKTLSAVATLSSLNPDCQVIQHQMRLDAGNIDSILPDYDIVLDGCDNFETRLAVGDACHRHGVTLVSAAVGMFDGQLTVFASHDGKSPCYRCFMPEVPSGSGGTCSEDGIIGALTGVLGSWAALEVIKLITGAGKPLIGRLVLFEGLEGASRTIKLRRDPQCPTCSVASGS